MTSGRPTVLYMSRHSDRTIVKDGIILLSFNEVCGLNSSYRPSLDPQLRLELSQGPRSPANGFDASS